MIGVQPYRSSSPAIPNETDSRDVSLTGPSGIGHRGIEVAEHLLIRNLAYNLAQDFTNVSHFGNITLPCEQFRSDCQVSELCIPPAHVFDMLMHTEYFLNDKHDREILSGFRHGSIGRDHTV